MISHPLPAEPDHAQRGCDWRSGNSATFRAALRDVVLGTTSGGETVTLGSGLRSIGYEVGQVTEQLWCMDYPVARDYLELLLSEMTIDGVSCSDSGDLATSLLARAGRLDPSATQKLPPAGHSAKDLEEVAVDSGSLPGPANLVRPTSSRATQGSAFKGYAGSSSSTGQQRTEGQIWGISIHVLGRFFALMLLLYLALVLMGAPANVETLAIAFLITGFWLKR